MTRQQRRRAHRATKITYENIRDSFIGKLTTQMVVRKETVLPAIAEAAIAVGDVEALQGIRLAVDWLKHKHSKPPACVCCPNELSYVPTAVFVMFRQDAQHGLTGGICQQCAKLTTDEIVAAAERLMQLSSRQINPANIHSDGGSA